MKNADANSGDSSQLPMPGLEGYLIPLLKAMHAQTEAINRLAGSNDLLAQALIQSMDGGEEEGLAPQYLSGKAR